MKDDAITASVEIWDKDTRLGTLPVDPDGSWSFSAAGLASGAHIFRAQVGDKLSLPWTVNIVNDQIELPLPHIRNAQSVGPSREEIDYYAHEGDGYVEFPNLTLKKGDTVRVTWVGRSVTYKSEIQEVIDPATPLNFKISMYEIIDCIGVNASISYTLIRPPSDQVNTSPILLLTIKGHVGEIEAPTINSPDNNNIRVHFEEDYYSAQVRFIGLTTVETSIREFHGKNLNFSIDSAWRAANKGKPVLFNYSLKRYNNDRIFYSRILRVSNL